MLGKVRVICRRAFPRATKECIRPAVGIVIAIALLTAATPTVPAQAFSHTCAGSRTVSYSFGNINDPSHPTSGEIVAVREALSVWSQVANFQYTQGTVVSSDFAITWFSGSHAADGMPFDGPGGVRAHSFPPCEEGGIHFDADETWSLTTGVPFGQPVFLKSIAMHESGHKLGLLDSNDPASVMYQGGEWMPTKLAWDDIAGVQHLYGRVNSLFHLRNSNTTGSPDSSFFFNNFGDRPVAGDWNGDGDETIGIWRPSNGNFILREGNPFGEQTAFGYGKTGDRPVVGDWDGNGTTTAGIYRPSNVSFYLDNTNTSSSSEYFFAYGTSEDLPVSGDWDGNGTETIGIFRPSNGTFHLRNSNSAGPAALIFSFGANGDQPVVGDWNNDGIDTVGVYRPSTGMFYLRNSNSAGVPDLEIAYGRTNLGVVIKPVLPVAADWDNNGTETIGLYQN